MANLTSEGRPTHSPATGWRYHRFRQRPSPGYQQDLDSLSEALTAIHAVGAQITVGAALSAVDELPFALGAFDPSRMDSAPTNRSSAVSCVLRHVLGQGRTVWDDGNGITPGAPERTAVHLNDPGATQVTRRCIFASAHNSQLGKPGTLEFISTTPRRGVDRQLMSGAELAGRFPARGIINLLTLLP